MTLYFIPFRFLPISWIPLLHFDPICSNRKMKFSLSFPIQLNGANRTLNFKFFLLYKRIETSRLFDCHENKHIHDPPMLPFPSLIPITITVFGESKKRTSTWTSSHFSTNTFKTRFPDRTKTDKSLMISNFKSSISRSFRRREKSCLRSGDWWSRNSSTNVPAFHTKWFNSLQAEQRWWEKTCVYRWDAEGARERTRISLS